MSKAMQRSALELPLHGVHAIEASAGTGKTFTLATLVLRLVVERRLRIGQVLAVTFTVAATQELRARIRARLLLASALVGTPATDEDSAEAAITRCVIDDHLHGSGESEAALRRRLRDAADGIDLAPVFTIHGFCARVLREHALDTGQGFDAPALLANDKALREEVAADLWRAHGGDDAGAEDLLMLFGGGPDALASALPKLLGDHRLLPAPMPLAEPPVSPAAAGQALAAAVDAHGEAFRDALLAACEAGVLNANSFKPAWIVPLFDRLQAWRETDPGAPFDHPKLGNLERDILQKRTKKGMDAKTPASPLSDAIADYRSALAAYRRMREARRVHLLHRLRSEGRVRMATRKRQLQVQTHDDLIGQVDAALQGEGGEALALALRAQYAVALVDEFQDTDPKQWRIFQRVFGSGADPALYLIGDPKQAIYGFRGGDVETYLAARAQARAAPPLVHNFRSRPALLEAIAALYAQAGEAAFIDTRIRFEPVQPGGRRADTDYLRDGAAAPALTIWQLDGDPLNAEASRQAVTAACVAAIHEVLSAARQGQASIDDNPVQPGDIAVLVRNHKEATRIRLALSELGIPAVAAGKQSLFATDEAHEVHTLLLALLHLHDEGRLRAALGTVLLGLDAAGIHALDADAHALRGLQEAMQRHRWRLDHGGPLALIGELAAEQAPRLLGLLDGERRLTNTLQLAEHLQDAHARVQGLPGLIDWLGRAIATADADDEAQLLRLESDARRVQIVTLHKSKGLEYPLVFLPFAGIHGKDRAPGDAVELGDADGRRLHWKLQEDTSGWGEAVQQWQAAGRAEDARLLYVGLTRARDSLWMASGALCGHARTVQHAMLSDPDALAEASQGRIIVDRRPASRTLPRLPPDADETPMPARTATRTVHSDWWVHSFSQLSKRDGRSDHNAAATQPDEAAADEIEATTDTADDRRFGGTGFGNAMHDALERVDFAAWADWHEGAAPPAGQQAVLEQALRGRGFAETLLADGSAELARLVGRTLTVPLPEGGALCALPSAERRAEIEFHFSLRSTAVPDLLALLHRHGIAMDREGFGQRRVLEGLLNGKIDLTYRNAGRWHVLDYKSNRLPGYDIDAMRAAMRHSEYDLQALIYTLALHRWLRFRLGEAYDYGRDFGGIRYLFARGLQPQGDPTAGVHAQCFDPALVQALDALFGVEGASSSPQGEAA